MSETRWKTVLLELIDQSLERTFNDASDDWRAEAEGLITDLTSAGFLVTPQVQAVLDAAKQVRLVERGQPHIDDPAYGIWEDAEDEALAMFTAAVDALEEGIQNP